MLGRWDHWSFHRDHRSEWRWSRYADARVVGKSTEGYHHRRDAEANATRLGWNLSAWPISNQRDRWDFYRDREGLWRWRRQALNGQIVGAAHVGFTALAACNLNAKRHGWQQPESGPGGSSPGPGEWKTCTG